MAGLTDPTAKLVILGTDHSLQLFSEAQQPAVFRAFFERVQPDVICIEHPLEDYSRGDYAYGEYAYEKIHIALPWAREHRVPIYPVDWVPPAADHMLVWNVPNIESPGFVRHHSYVRSFIAFGRERINSDLFLGESQEAQQPVNEWYDQPRQLGERDFPRRVGLYRTFMQAMRVKSIAHQHIGQTILVVIGYFHKEDIERVLSNDPAINLIQSSEFGYPASAEIEQHIRHEDLLAVLTFNLLGMQCFTGAINLGWMSKILARLDNENTAEISLLHTRYELLANSINSETALRAYQDILHRCSRSDRFTYDGVQDHSRIDSYFDPFGNLGIHQRTLVEIGRENSKLGHHDKAAALLDEVLSSGALSKMQQAQLRVYWHEYVDSRTL